MKKKKIDANESRQSQIERQIESNVRGYVIGSDQLRKKDASDEIYYLAKERAALLRNSAKTAKQSTRVAKTSRFLTSKRRLIVQPAEAS